MFRRILKFVTLPRNPLSSFFLNITALRLSFHSTSPSQPVLATTDHLLASVILVNKFSVIVLIYLSYNGKDSLLASVVNVLKIIGLLKVLFGNTEVYCTGLTSTASGIFTAHSTSSDTASSPLSFILSLLEKERSPLISLSPEICNFAPVVSIVLVTPLGIVWSA